MKRVSEINSWKLWIINLLLWYSKSHNTLPVNQHADNEMGQKRHRLEAKGRHVSSQGNFEQFQTHVHSVNHSQTIRS